MEQQLYFWIRLEMLSNIIIFYQYFQTASAYEGFRLANGNVIKLQNQFTLKSGQWYSDGLDWLYVQNFFSDLVERIMMACLNANVDSPPRFVTNSQVLLISVSLYCIVWYFSSF